MAQSMTPAMGLPIIPITLVHISNIDESAFNTMNAERTFKSPNTAAGLRKQTMTMTVVHGEVGKGTSRGLNG